MPIIKIVTNLPKSKITDSFVKKASVLSAELTERPEQYIELIIEPDQIISFSGTQEPAAYVFIGGIGCLDTERRTPIGKAFHDFLVAELGLKSERFYIQFYSVQPTEVAFTGKLFSDILAGK